MAKAKQAHTQIAENIIVEKVHVIRGAKVMVDKDLADRKSTRLNSSHG